MGCAKARPSLLVVLQTITGPFDLDQFIPALVGKKLDQVRQAGAVVTDVL
jgi:hypothetical protein